MSLRICGDIYNVFYFSNNIPKFKVMIFAPYPKMTIKCHELLREIKILHYTKMVYLR